MMSNGYIHGDLLGYVQKTGQIVSKSTEPWAPSFSVQTAPPPPGSAPGAPKLPKPTQPPDIESDVMSSKKTVNGADIGTKN